MPPCALCLTSHVGFFPALGRIPCLCACLLSSTGSSWHCLKPLCGPESLILSFEQHLSAPVIYFPPLCIPGFGACSAVLGVTPQCCDKELPGDTQSGGIFSATGSVHSHTSREEEAIPHVVKNCAFPKIPKSFRVSL